MGPFRMLAEGVSLFFLVGTWLVALRNFSRLPPSIPIHFGLTGQPDQWGKRAFIWLIPSVALLEYGVMTAVNFAPGPPSLGLMVLAIKVELTVMMYYIVREMVRVALGFTNRMGNLIWFFIILLVGTSLIAPVLLPSKK